MSSTPEGFLPECIGPKLGPFAHPNTDLNFSELISDNELGDSSDVGHAHVFKVVIGSNTFALKIFKYYDDTDIRDALSDHQQEVLPTNLTRDQMDPFFNECRAYGKMIDAKINGIVAVRCHGYLLIPATRELELRQRFGVTAWNRPEAEYSMPAQERQPLRAIVKDLVIEDAPLTAKIARKMLADLRRIRRLGIYNMDIQARNYKAGRLLDFSVAMTAPHYLFLIKPPWPRKMYRDDDLVSFDRMLEEAGVQDYIKATDSTEYTAKLRPRNEKGRAVTNI